MKTKFIFAFVALLMLGSATLKAQEESKGSTSTDYSKQPFTIVPIEKDLTIVIMGDDDCGAFDSVEMYWSYDQGETWM